MPLIKEIETMLPEVAELPQRSQIEIAVTISRMVMAYDNTLTMTLNEQQRQRQNELDAFKKHFAPITH